MKKLFNGLVVLTQAELTERAKEQYRDGVEEGKKTSKTRIESLEAGLERKEKLATKLQTQVTELKEIIEVHEEERDKARDVVKQQIKNEDLESMLEAKQEMLDEREARIKDQLTELDSAESKVKQSAYADGLADGLRKAHEITAQDRENAMKIAMVSAASHTPTETMKELNNVHQLTAGSSDK